MEKSASYTHSLDDDRRDNSVARFICNPNGHNEFIIFQPTGIGGLADSASVGGTLDFRVTGV
jgi:hypothetical protein